MRRMKRMMICLLFMGMTTAATGCDDYLYDLGYDYDYGYWDGYYDNSGGSSSGTFFSDYGGSLSWW